MSAQINRRTFLGSAAAAPAALASPAASGEKSWEGIYIIMQTPFLESLEIDEESLRKESDFLARCGVHGVVWPAGAGETVSLSYSERMKYSRAVVEAVKGRSTVLIGVHGPNKFEAMEHARHAEKIGADGLHALGPSNDSSDPGILEEYFTAIASVSKLPMSLQVSTPGMSPDFLMRLAEKLPTIRIIKEEGAQVPHKVTRYAKDSKRKLIVSTGGGGLNLLNEIARGSGGTMAGAGFADLQVQIWNLAKAGKKKESRDVFAKFLLMAALERHTGYVLQKEILRRRGIFKTVVMRNTRRFTMDDGDLRELDEIMEIARPHFTV